MKDPVCGMDVQDKKICSSYQGSEYCFCSSICKKTFDKNPEKYSGGNSQKGCCSCC